MGQLETKYICRSPGGELALATLAGTPAQAQFAALKLAKASIEETLSRWADGVRVPPLAWRDLAASGWSWLEVRAVQSEDPVFGYPLTRLVEVGTSAKGLAEPRTTTAKGLAEPRTQRWQGTDQGPRSGGPVDETQSPGRVDWPTPGYGRRFFSRPEAENNDR